MTGFRVLHFLGSGHVGGAERAVYQIVREEAARGEWEVGVAFGSAEGPYYEAIKSLGCELLDLKMRSGPDLGPALRSVGELRNFNIHHFHVLEPSLMMASARCDGTTRVFTQRHGAQVDPISLRKKMRRSLGGLLLRRYFHAVTGNTLHAARWAVGAYRLEALPCEVTPNGIDFSLLTPLRDRWEVRCQLEVQPESLLVGSSGTFKGWKRFDRLVTLAGSHPGMHVALVGDGGQRSSLESQALALGAKDRLHVTGLVQNVADYLQTMDIFILPSSAEESFGNSVVEAMAMGLPSVVFSDSPGICEHIEDGVTGFIVDDETGLASVVERLAADPGLRTRVGAAAAQSVRSKYSLDNMHESYRRLYEAALGTRH